MDFRESLGGVDRHAFEASSMANRLANLRFEDDVTRMSESCISNDEYFAYNRTQLYLYGLEACL